VTLADGSVRNGYTVKILNMKREDRSYHLRLSGVKDAQMTVIGHAKEPVKDISLNVRSDSVSTFRVFVYAARAALKSDANVMRFVVTEEQSQKIMDHETSFRGPEK